MDKDKIFYFYIQKDRLTHRVLNSWTNQCSDMTIQDVFNLKKKYEVLNVNYDTDDDDVILKLYRKDFDNWNKELRLGGLDSYNFSYSNSVAIMSAFQKNSTFILKTQPLITTLESNYFEACYNGDLSYAGKEEVTHQCYGYDMNAFYPRILAEKQLQIPIKEGCQYKLESLDFENLKFGFYRVVIECYHPDFLKMFKFSPNQTYTSYDLKFAYIYQKEFGITIDLNDSEEYNAYLYEEEDLIYTKEIFGEWFKKLMPVKKDYPNNRLVKHLLASLWGQLSKKVKPITIKLEDMHEYDCEFPRDSDENTEYLIHEIADDKVKLVNTKKRYVHQIRLKPFLRSYCRCVMGQIAYDNHLTEIVRIFCDNIVYKSDVKIKVEFFEPEKKTTGMIRIKNSKELFHICQKCKNEFKYCDFTSHSC